ncbi:uncharacterized protein LOC121780712 isoform X2 [Salvia splendens]|uniref:uncharacterized protein LOC121780712 isoform X2 n=1 Tax=Salvia splendens TaxID=180675 RepID=UPI001C27A165|nr:uncharacterized protein LOC121780712 isoform X2 [Salvia splendens]
MPSALHVFSGAYASSPPPLPLHFQMIRSRFSPRTLLRSCTQVHLKNHSKCSGKMDRDSLCSMFGLLDADFLSDAKMLEIEKGARELNLPIIKSNRELAASANGGLENPSSLVFSASWSHDHAQHASKRFNYPSLPHIERPKSDEDIAFMSILELGQLIKSKQITSEVLAQIFLNRLKRYGPVLESVITITEELAYEQARKADQLLAQGKYLGNK